MDAGVRRSRTRTTVAMLLVVVHLGGCFRWVPATTTQPGAPITVSINDRGRVGLAESIGPGVQRIRGHMRENAEDRIVLAMESVEFSDVNVTVLMPRERVEIPRDYINEVRERQLSTSRTILAAVIAAAGLIATSFIVVSGFGSDDDARRPDEGGGNGQTQ